MTQRWKLFCWRVVGQLTMTQRWKLVWWKVVAQSKMTQRWKLFCWIVVGQLTMTQRWKLETRTKMSCGILCGTEMYKIPQDYHSELEPVSLYWFQ